MEAKEVILKMGSTPAECLVTIDGIVQKNVAGFAATLSIEEGPKLILQRDTGMGSGGQPLDFFDEISFPDIIVEHEAEALTVGEITRRVGGKNGTR